MEELEKIIQRTKKCNGIVRKLDELGRIVVPKDYRQAIVVDGETEVAIYHNKDYVIVEILKELNDTNRKFDELGRIVINKEIRNKLEWKEKDSIEIWHFEQYFILKKVADECIFCGKKKV